MCSFVWQFQNTDFNCRVLSIPNDPSMSVLVVFPFGVPKIQISDVLHEFVKNSDKPVRVHCVCLFFVCLVFVRELFFEFQRY